MEQWQVGPVPEYVYSNSTHPPNDMHNHQYQTDMSRRNDQFPPYGATQPGMTPQQQQQQQQQQKQPGQPPQQQQQHHVTPSQTPMSISQASNVPGPQPQTQPPTPVQSGRQRKRPAPATAPSPATAQSGTPAGAASQAHQPGQNISAPQAAAAAATAASGGSGIAPPPPTAQSQAAAQDANAAGGQPPPAKKSRTNTPWTPQEELRLKQMRDAGNSWAEIAKTFPTRTEGSVKKHWYKDMHYAEFAEDESQALLNAIKEYENNKWKVIGQKVGKPAKACEQYAKEHFPGKFAV